MTTAFNTRSAASAHFGRGDDKQPRRKAVWRNTMQGMATCGPYVIRYQTKFPHGDSGYIACFDTRLTKDAKVKTITLSDGVELKVNELGSYQFDVKCRGDVAVEVTRVKALLYGSYTPDALLKRMKPLASPSKPSGDPIDDWFDLSLICE